ncbi:sterol o-acyltransferase [Anaeramoeba flamelloides]|uniref:O-acyltransferase n=1 Tax=Anaeramoeba flamelloides TaxID=1746091 RepID=A0AAV7Y341_9EUKA|nr:sterol o-acyltransferase [Anaeramoeba flamelloides]
MKTKLKNTNQIKYDKIQNKKHKTQTGLEDYSNWSIKSILGLLPMLIFGLIELIVIKYFNIDCQFTYNLSLETYLNIFVPVPKLAICLSLTVFSYCLFYPLKRLYLKGYCNYNLLMVLRVILSIGILSAPVFLLKIEINPFLNSFVGLVPIVTLLKSHSYLEVMFEDLRSKTTKKEKAVLRQELIKSQSIGDFVHFSFRPNLVYENKCVLLKKINYRRIFVYLIFSTILNFFMLFVVTNMFNRLKVPDHSLKGRIQTAICLGPSNGVFWVTQFMLVYHCFLTLLADLTRYQDRNFYGNWINCTSISDFWKKWNTLVNVYSVKHIYKPLRKTGKVSVIVAGLTVFATSGLLHEYIIWATFGVFDYMWLLVFLTQPILIFIEKLLSPFKLKIWIQAIKVVNLMILMPIAETIAQKYIFKNI